MTQTEKRNLADNVNRLLLQKGISRYRLAKELGVTYKTVFEWCNCIRGINNSHLYDIANFFSVSVSDLLKPRNTEDNFDDKLYKQIIDMTYSYLKTRKKHF